MKKIRSTIIIIFSIASILIALAYFLGNQSYIVTEKAIVSEFNQRQLSLANGAARGIEQYLKTLAGKMMVIADSSDIQEFDETASRRLLKNTFADIKFEGVNDIGILDKTGVLRFGVNAPFLEGVDFSFRNYFKEAKGSSGHTRYFIEFIEFKGVDIGRKGIAIAVPIIENSHDGGEKFRGVILSTVYLDVVAEVFIAPIEGSKRGHAYLVDKKNTVLWAPDKSLFGKDLLKETRSYKDFNDIAVDIVRGQTGVAEATFKKFDESSKKFLDEDEDIIIAYTPVSIGDKAWSISVWAPKTDALDLVKKAKRNMNTVTQAIMLIIFITSVITTVFVMRSTSRLEENEERFRRIAGVLQEALIKPVPDIPQLDVWVGYESAFKAERVGGDFYDIFVIDEERVAFLIGDVAGKGIEAAGNTETIRSSIRTLLHVNVSPAFVLENTNQVFLGQISDEVHATAQLMIIDLKNRSMTIASAGHPPPILIDSKEEINGITFGLPLGIYPTTYKEIKIDLIDQTGLILFTDGLTEARKENNFFGVEGIIESLNSSGASDTKDIVEDLLYQVTTFVDGRLSDDLAIIALRFRNSKEIKKEAERVKDKKSAVS